MTSQAASGDGADHTFKAIYDRDIPWGEGVANDLLTLPKGVQV